MMKLIILLLTLSAGQLFSQDKCFKVAQAYWASSWISSEGYLVLKHPESQENILLDVTSYAKKVLKVYRDELQIPDSVKDLEYDHSKSSHELEICFNKVVIVDGDIMEVQLSYNTPIKIREK